MLPGGLTRHAAAARFFEKRVRTDLHLSASRPAEDEIVAPLKRARYEEGEIIVAIGLFGGEGKAEIQFPERGLAVHQMRVVVTGERRKPQIKRNRRKAQGILFRAGSILVKRNRQGIELVPARITGVGTFVGGGPVKLPERSLPSYGGIAGSHPVGTLRRRAESEAHRKKNRDHGNFLHFPRAFPAFPLLNGARASFSAKTLISSAERR